MIRTPPSHARPRRPVLPVAVGVLAVLALLPTRFTAWLAPLGSVADVIAAPAQWPLAAGLRAVHAQVRSGPGATPEAAELRRNAQGFEQLYLQALDENRRLVRTLTEMQRGSAVPSGVRVHQVAADVIGPSADATTTLLKVKAGTAAGIGKDSVAAFEGVHLVGLVVDADTQIARVLPATDRAAGKLDGLVMLGTSPTGGAGGAAGGGGGGGGGGPLDSALRCLLEPTGDGRLRGPVEVPAARADAPPPEVRPGMVVRLAGERWPAPARMLIVGYVERVEPAANGRPMVVVKPAFEVRDLSSVILRAPARDGQQGGGGRP